MQICDRYLALARDASSAGDRIKAEGYLQHAEHYYRVVHGDDGQQGQNQGQGQGRYNGRRDAMVAPAEVALSGERAPMHHMGEQAEPAPDAEGKNRSGSDASPAPGESGNGTRHGDRPPMAGGDAESAGS